MLLSLRPADEADVLIKTSLLADNRLSAEAIGALVFFQYAARSGPIAVEDIMGLWNEGRPKQFHIKKDKLRRIVNEWRKAGYATVEMDTDDEGKVVKKSIHVFAETQDPIDRPTYQKSPVVLSNKGETAHKYPAAQIFQEVFAVDLDLDSIRHIEKEVAQDFQTWKRVCSDHAASLTPQQKDSVTYKTRAVKFCLSDLRREQELASFRKTKSPMSRTETDESPPERKTFSDYAASYGHGSEEYKNFKKSWLKRAEEKGNDEAIKQVEDYERIQLSLGRVKERKRGVEK